MTEDSPYSDPASISLSCGCQLESEEATIHELNVDGWSMIYCHLHSAAPKLLAALEGLVEAVEHGHLGMSQVDEIAQAREAIREAKA